MIKVKSERSLVKKKKKIKYNNYIDIYKMSYRHCCTLNLFCASSVSGLETDSWYSGHTGYLLGS